MTTTVRQETSLPTPPAEVYRALAESERHTAFTGAPATIGSAAGEPFSTHGGAIAGWMLELADGERIVQAWRPADWPDGVYSVVRYELADDGEGGTDLVLTHTGLPEDAVDSIAQGWQQRYWEPLAAYLS